MLFQGLGLLSGDFIMEELKVYECFTGTAAVEFVVA